MSTQFVPHFEEIGRINPKTSQDLMPEVAYSSALDHLVFTCVDIAFLHQGHLLLAQRNRYPRKTWWLIGGRMVAGESPIATAQRKASEEAQLHDLAAHRFQFIGVYSTVFARREQPPVENGSHSVNLTYQIELTTVEKQALTLTPTEYESDYGWFKLAQIEQRFDPENSLDRALLQIAEDLQLQLAIAGRS